MLHYATYNAENRVRNRNLDFSRIVRETVLRSSFGSATKLSILDITLPAKINVIAIIIARSYFHSADRISAQ